MPFKDPDKAREKQREYLVRWRSANREDVRRRNRGYKTQGHAIFAEWKSSGCAVCGCRDVDLIDAHHIDPASKDWDVARILQWHTRLRAELEKCVPLCEKHHVEAHATVRRAEKGQSCDAS